MQMKIKISRMVIEKKVLRIIKSGWGLNNKSRLFIIVSEIKLIKRKIFLPLCWVFCFKIYSIQITTTNE